MNITDENLPRRGFLKIAIAVLNGLIALALAIPGLGYLLTPVFRKGEERWIDLGSIDEFKSMEPQKAIFSYITESGYIREERKGFVWVLADSGEEEHVMVLSAVCTHTGCNVAWHADVGKFVCPCHEGMYNREGEVISGPPPRPLAKLPTRVENGKLSIQLSA